ADLVVLGICGHPVPEPRRESGRAFSDNSVEPFGHGSCRFPHLRDLRKHGALPVSLARLHLLDAVPYRASFLLRECFAGHCAALGGLLRALLCRSHGIRFVFSELKYLFTSSFFVPMFTYQLGDRLWRTMSDRRDSRSGVDSLWSNPGVWGLGGRHEFLFLAFLLLFRSCLD